MRAVREEFEIRYPKSKLHESVRNLALFLGYENAKDARKALNKRTNEAVYDILLQKAIDYDVEQGQAQTPAIPDRSILTSPEQEEAEPSTPLTPSRVNPDLFDKSQRISQHTRSQSRQGQE